MSSKTRTPRPRRVPAKIRIDQSTIDMFYQSEIMNISLGGVFIAADIVLPLGSKVDFDFTLPKTRKKVQVKGTVVWARKVNADDQGSFPEHPAGMGVQFDHISVEDIEALIKEIEHASS